MKHFLIGSFILAFLLGIGAAGRWPEVAARSVP
jgi:hypothetical protein